MNGSELGVSTPVEVATGLIPSAEGSADSDTGAAGLRTPGLTSDRQKAEDASHAVACVVQSFHDRHALGGLLLGRGHPDGPALRVSEDVGRRIAAAGRHGLTQFIQRTGVSLRDDVHAGLLALALDPTLYAATADTPHVTVVDPRDVIAFAHTAAGVQARRRLDVRPDLLTREWAACVNSILFDGKPGRAACAALAKLAACATAAGHVTPTRLLAATASAEAPGAVSFDLDEAARKAGWTRKSVVALRSGLRAARGRLQAALDDGARLPLAAEARRACVAAVSYLDGLAAEQVAVGPRTLARTVTRLGVPVPELDPAEAHRVARAAAALGLESPGDRAAFALIVTLAPRFEPLLTARRTGRKFGARGAPIRPATARNLLDTIGRLLAQVLIDDPGRSLHSLGPEMLLAERVPADRLAVASAAAAGFRWLHTAAGAVNDGESNDQPGSEPESVVPTVPWLQHLIVQQAAASAARSPRLGMRGEPGQLGITDTLINDVRHFGQAFRRAVRAYQAAAPEQAEKLLRVSTVATTVENDLRASELRAPDDPDVKQIAAMLEMVTWPQLCCVGLPWLRAKVRRLRRQLYARPRSARRRADWAHYLEWVECYVVLACVAYDLMRAKSLRRARAGSELYLTVEELRGTRVVTAAHTYFADKGPAQTKNSYESVWTRGGMRARLRDPRRLRWSPTAIDFVLLLDYLELVRAPRLQLHGIDASVGSDAGQDAAAGAPVASPLFVIERAAAGEDGRGGPEHPLAMSPGTFRLRFARALHAVCREAFARPLPEWDEFKETMGSRYYGACTPHFLRHAAITYLLGARANGRVAQAPNAVIDDGEWPARPGDRTIDVATRLLYDKQRTLRKDYLHWTEEMAARMRAAKQDWEHPAAYDRWMDLLLCGVDIDWGAEADLPLPPGLSLTDFAVE